MIIPTGWAPFQKQGSGREPYLYVVHGHTLVIITFQLYSNSAVLKYFGLGAFFYTLNYQGS